MNEAKPLVTCHGSSSVFTSLQKHVEQGLPKESCEWKRSYGRAARPMHLDASFVPYDPDILPDEEEKTLVSRPYFHVYWTDCDVDTYRQTVKDDIAEWQAALKMRNIPDWLIVVVSSDEGRVKAKLLPRSSVLDKVKSDFCNKCPERCIALTEPVKLDSKSSESWSQFFHRLRTLLLQALNRQLSKYEDSMRSRREKRNETGWNYFSYFILQEELAFMLEMLGLNEDALIQYDELDAMFDQSVDNFANGEPVKWLQPLMKACTCWAGVSLARPLDHETRDNIKQSNVGLLDFRNYLFCRQATLLFQMGRAWEVAMRAINYLHNTVLEMKALEVEVPEGALGCWVFVSCLEVLQGCQQHSPSPVDDKFALYTANLWDYAHRKLRELGNVCSLMPGLVPTSAQLSLVVDLVSGMGLSQANLSSAQPRPVDTLRESLSSPASFKKHYLDMCEQAMGTYKYINRFRSARIIGLELAEFYMKIKEPQKAENLLQDSIRMYQQEGWNLLAAGTMIQLAQCHKMQQHLSSYLKTSCQIACCAELPMSDRTYYFTEAMNILDQSSDAELKTQAEVRALGLITVESLELDQTSVSLDEHIRVTAVVCSYFPVQVVFDSIQISIHKCTETEALQCVPGHQQQHSKTSRHQGSHVLLDPSVNTQQRNRQLPSQINLQETVEWNNKRLVACGISCDHAHQLLKRADSTSYSYVSAPLVKDDYKAGFCQSSVTVTPGRSTLVLSTKVHEKGVFYLGQIFFRIKSLELLQSLRPLNAVFKIDSVLPEFILLPQENAQFLSGIEQKAILVCKTGHYSLQEESSLSFTTSPFFSICSEEGAPDVRLGPLEPHSISEIPVSVYCHLHNEHKLISQVGITVEKWEKTFHQNVQFLQPFTATHKVYTAGRQKYFQITLQGCSDTSLTFLEPQLDAPDFAGLELQLLNPHNQTLAVQQDQSVSLLWLVKSSLPLPPVLHLSFTCLYRCPLDASPQPHEFNYNCSLDHCETQYLLSYTVSSIEEDKSCTTGETAILDIRIKQLYDTGTVESTRLAYSVQASGTVWAVGGKSAGVFTMKEGKHSIVLDVVPLRAGHLNVPLVTIFKYLDQVEDQVMDDAEYLVEEALARVNPKAEETASEFGTFTGMTTSRGASSSPHLIEFGPDQVYNESKSKQVQVFPAHTSADVHISLEQ